MPVRISKNRVALENIPLNLAPEVDVASATTTNIGAATSNNVRITGTTTITAFDSVTSGVIRFIRFGGALTLTHNSTSLILPGGANITTAAGDSCLAVSLGSGNWIVHFYQKASGAAVVASSNKNAIINGNFNIWQRGTSFNHGGGVFSADRWRSDQGSGSADYTTSRQSVTTGEPFTYCARINRNTTSTITSFFYTALESVNSLFARGKYVTLAFYARKGAGFSGAFTAHIYSGTGTDQSTPHTFTGVIDNSTSDLASSLTTSFQRFTLTTTAQLATSTNQLGVTFNTSGSGTPSNDYVEIAGVQLEEGSSATAFEYRTLGQEIALCQRYYCKSFNINTTPANGSTAANFATSYGIYESAAVRAATGVNASDDGSSVYTNPGGTVRFPVSMRATPTVTKYGNSSGNWRIKDSANDNWPSVPIAEIGTGGFVVSVSSWINVDVVAYTVGHWVANAEL